MDLNDILDSALDDFEAQEKGQIKIKDVSQEDVLNDPSKFAAGLKSLVDEMAKDGTIPAQEMNPMMDSLAQLMSSIEKTSASQSSSMPAASVEASIEKMMQAVTASAKSCKPESSAGTSSMMPGLDENFDASKMDDIFKKMLGDFTDSTNGLDIQDKGNMDKMMEDMMSQMKSLFSKDMMRQPMLDITQKYPGWFEKNRTSLSETELKQYEQQFDCFKRICKELEKPGDDMKEIMDLMQEMQAYGNPPKDILEELMPGVGAHDPTAPMPPVPPELADMDPEKMKEMCKMQ